jgi:hypothetical protein
VNEHDFAIPADVRMAILVGHAAVRRPARMADAQAAAQPAILDEPIEL